MKNQDNGNSFPKTHNPDEAGSNQQPNKPEAHKPMGAPDRDAAIRELIWAMGCIDAELHLGGPFQAAIDRAKVAMKADG